MEGADDGGERVVSTQAEKQEGQQQRQQQGQQQQEQQEGHNGGGEEEGETGRGNGGEEHQQSKEEGSKADGARQQDREQHEGNSHQHQRRHVRGDGGDNRVWCATCGRYEQLGDTGPAVIRVEHQAGGNGTGQTPYFQQWTHEEAVEYYRRHKRHEQMLQQARNATSAAPFRVRAASPELSGRRAVSSAPSHHHRHHRRHHYRRNDDDDGDDAGAQGGEGDEGEDESERQSLIGKPSLEVMHRPPVLPSLGHDPLACLSYINRTNEVLRNFQGNVAVMLGQAGAEKQSEELFRYVPPQLGFTPSHIEALENESATQPIEVKVAPEMDKLLNICVGLLSRVQHGFQRSLEALLSKDRTLIQDLTSENATLRDTLQHQAGEIDDLETRLQVEQQRHSEVLYTWPAMSNDALVVERMRDLQRAHRQLQEAHEEVLTELTAVRRENAELRAQLQTQRGTTPQYQQHKQQGRSVSPPTRRHGSHTAAATATAAADVSPTSTDRTRGHQHQHQHQRQRQHKATAHAGAPHSHDAPLSKSDGDGDGDGVSDDEDVHTNVNVFRGVTGAGLNASSQQPVPSNSGARNTAPLEQKMSTYSQTAAERLAKIPDLKLACLFQMYITWKRSQAMSETASHEFRLVRRRLELANHRISQWRDNKVGDWGIRLQQLAAIQDQLSLLVAATQPEDVATIPSTTTLGAVSSGTTAVSPSSSSTTAAAAQAGSSDSISQRRSMLGGPGGLARRRRSTLTFGEASDRYWMSNITSGLDETVDNSWLVTPHSLVLQVSRAHRGTSPAVPHARHDTRPGTPASRSGTAETASAQSARGEDRTQGSATAHAGKHQVTMKQMLTEHRPSSRSATRPRSRSSPHGRAHTTAIPKTPTAPSSSSTATGPAPSVNASLFLDALNAVSIPGMSQPRQHQQQQQQQQQQHSGHKASAAAAAAATAATATTTTAVGGAKPAATAETSASSAGDETGTRGGGGDAENTGTNQPVRLPPLT